MMKRSILAAAALAISWGAVQEATAAGVGVSYTVSGVPGNYDLDFSVSNNMLAWPTQIVYLFGVRLSAAGVIGSTANFTDHGADFNWFNYGGTATEYNNTWNASPSNGLLTGNTLSGFTVHIQVAGEAPPTSVPWSAVSYGDGAYTGGGNFLTSFNPGFEGIAHQTRPVTISTSVNGGTAIPGGTGAFTSFQSLAYPGVTSHPGIGGGDVVFLGAGTGGQQGIYAEVQAQGPPIKLADLTTAIPNGSGNFVGFFPQISSHGGVTAMLASGSAGQRGVYALSNGPPIIPGDPASGVGPPIRVADLNTAIPDGAGAFTGFPLVAPAISDGRLVFRGDGSAGQQGIYVLMNGPPIVPGDPVSANGPPIKVADANTVIPGGTGNFTGFAGSPAVSGANLAFIANGSSGQQGVYRVLQNGPPIFPGGPASMNGPPIKVADTQTAMPGSAGSFQSFESISMDRTVASASLAFIGGGTVGGVPVKGVYVSQQGPPIKVADYSTLVPEGTGTFSNFGGVAFDPDAAGNPITAFLGFGSAGQQGVYARFDGALRKVVDLGDMLDGKAPVSFSLGASGLDLGELTFAATFSDGSEGLFTSTLPLIAAADFDEDGDVDSDDLIQWQGDFGDNALSDADNDGDSDGADFLAWQRQLGSPLPVMSAVESVPEPGAGALILLAGCSLALARRRHR